MSEKMTLFFEAFLSSLTLPPLSIRNKELAAMLRVQDATVSKLRHGHSRVIPAQLRPFSAAEHFTEAVIKYLFLFRGKESVSEYSRGLRDTYRLSERLERLSDGVCAAMCDEDGQLMSQTQTLTDFFMLCYNESYQNSGVRIKNEQLEKHSQRVQPEEKTDIDALLLNIANSRYSGEELDRIERTMIKAMVQLDSFQYSSFWTFYNAFSSRMKAQALMPYYRSSSRREEIFIHEKEKLFERKVEMEEHLILPQKAVSPYFVRRALINTEKLDRDRLIESLFGDFYATVNGIPLIEYINSYGGKNYKTQREAITLTTVPGGRDSHVLAELEIPLTPSYAGEQFDINIKYQSRLSFIDDYSANYSYRLKYPCQFLAHEHVLSPETACRWQIVLDVFSAFNFAGNDDASNPVFLRKLSEDPGSDRSQSIILHDWVLPGTGYRRCILRNT